MNIRDCINIIKNCTMLSCEHHIKNKCDYGYEVRENRFECAKEIAIHVLEKQIPKNWIAEYIGDGDFAFKCPRCREIFILIDGTPQDNNYNYCPNCGQAMAESRTEL